MPPSSPEKRMLECSLGDSFRLILSSDDMDMDIDEYVNLEEAVDIDLDVSMDDVSLDEDITIEESFHYDGDVSLGVGAEDDFSLDSSLNEEFVPLEEAVAIVEATTDDVLDDPQTADTSKSLIEKDTNIYYL